jgi:hypothetical protein
LQLVKYLALTLRNPNKTQKNSKNSFINFLQDWILKYAMDNNKLKEWIKTVAEIRDIKPAKSPTHNRLPVQIITEVDEFGEEHTTVREVTENKTLGFTLVKLKDTHRLCEMGCGDIVTNQVIERRLCLNPESHWRTRCANCGVYASPDGQGFIEGGHAVAAAFMRYFNNRE